MTKYIDLWIAWEKHIHDSSPDPDIRWLLEQNAVEGFNHYAFLVVVRALDNLGYYPTTQYEEMPLSINGTWELTGPLDKLRLRRQESEIFLEKTDSGKCLKIIAIPSMLEACISIGEWLSSIKDYPHSRYILNVTADDSRVLPKERLRLRSLGNQGDDSSLMFSSIAPWDLESVERVTRAMRWFIWANYYQAYPPLLVFESGWSIPPNKPDWLKIVNSKGVAIRPSTDSNYSWNDLTIRLNNTLEEVAALQAKISHTKDSRSKLQFKLKLDEARSLLDFDKKVVEELSVAKIKVEKLLVCPVCSTRSTPYSFEEADNLFRCKCRDCDSVWGLRSCNKCHLKYPFIYFPGNEPTDDLSEIDRRYGSDILAIPLNDHSYLCPNCGQ